MTDNNRISDNGCNRRQLLIGSAAAATGTIIAANSKAKAAEELRPAPHHPPVANQNEQDVQVSHSVCLGCNARCGNRQLVRNGRLEKISGNPYHPYNSMGQPIPYDTPVGETLNLSSPVCGKAHDAVHYVYNDRRILRPLKRAGRRGEGRFEEISWDQLIKEIGHGGKLFADLGETREVPGLTACLSDDLIDPEDPYLGSRRNGFTLITGRLQSGRKEFIDRFVKSGVGSTNRIGHTDICGLGFRMGNYALTEGVEVELKADPWGAEYILVFGANIYEALQPGINTYGAAVAHRYAKNQVKFAIVDPRTQNASTHAHDWIPVIPGQDGAFAMAMIRWIVEHDKHNSGYLSLPNLGAAKAQGYSSYSNASHLVITDANHPHTGRFLRMADLKNQPTEQDRETWVVLDGQGMPCAYDGCDSAALESAKETAVTAENGKRITVATAFSLMKEATLTRTMAEYSELCGIPVAQIEKTATEFTSHGTKAAVCQYHGAGNYANGTYAAYSIAALNVLIGSCGMRGGYLNGGGAPASWKKGKYELNSFTGKRKPGGVKISRENGQYEKTTEYKKKQETGSGYPAKRPWFAFTKGGLSVEAMNGIDQQYPYQCQVLFTYFYNPVYSTPGGYRYIDTLSDEEKVPLHVSIDIGVNESNIYADYIVPDVTYLEGHYGWLNPHAPALRFTGVRAPCLEPLTGTTSDDRPFCLETLLIDLGKELNIPGFGKGAITAADGSSYDLNRAEDFFLRAYANIAAGAKLPEAGAAEVALVEQNYPLARFKDMLQPAEWRQVCYMLVRGGVFSNYEAVFDGDTFKHGIERFALYNETLATTANSLTGKLYPGTLHYMAPSDSTGQAVAEKDRDYPFTVITHKMHVHTQSRTGWHKYAMELFPENTIQVNVADAARLGLKNGDTVELQSASRPTEVTGKIALTQTVRPGCVAISFHYGHSQLGAAPLTVKGAMNVFQGGKAVCENDIVSADSALGAGTNPNMVGRLDDNLGSTPLVDVLAGIPDFSSTRVKLKRIG